MPKRGDRLLTPHMSRTSRMIRFASRGEGFGLPPIEKAIVGYSAAVSPARTVHEVNRDAPLYAGDDPQLLIEAVRCYTADPALRKSKIEAARACPRTSRE